MHQIIKTVKLIPSALQCMGALKLQEVKMQDMKMLGMNSLHILISLLLLILSFLTPQNNTHKTQITVLTACSDELFLAFDFM